MFDRLCPLKEAARDTPRGLALLIKGRSFSFSELDQESDRLALLLHRIGIQPGSRIAVFHPPDWRLIALFFALWRLGATLCPLNLRLTKVQIEECLFRLDPALYLTDLEEIPPSILPAPCFLPSPSLLLFTSGSTGTPKIAALNLSQLLASAQGALKALDLCAQDQWLLTLPLYHVGGIGILIRCILARATLVLDEKSPHITHLSYVPTQLYHASPIYPKLRCLLLGGASISSYPSSLPIYLTYGLTEMSSLVALRYKPPLKMGHYYLGPPLEKRELRLAADGEIWVRGETLFQGYWEMGRLHLPVDREGWFATGDLGCFCNEEGVAIVGRKDWQFISGGENIQPEEIERELRALPQIEEVVVIPIADDEFGARPAAVICSNDSTFDLKKLQNALRNRLPKYKIPIALFSMDEFPKNGLKIDRKKIFEIIDKTRSK